MEVMVSKEVDLSVTLVMIFDLGQGKNLIWFWIRK